MSHGRNTAPKPYGIVAEFDSGEKLLAATKKCYAEGYRKMEGYSPIPVHGLTDALGHKDNRLGWAVFFAGITGACLGMGLQWYTSVGLRISDYFSWWPALESFIAYSGLNGYAHNTGGKPLFSLPAFIPVTFELTILLSGLTAAGAMFAFNGLPKPHHPIFNAECMARASQDRFILCIEADDALYSKEETESFVQALEPLTIEFVETSEGY